MAVDYGPLAVFFAVNALAPGNEIGRILAATAAFMVAIAAALIFSWVKAGHISPMLWLSGGLVLVFGSLTLYFHDRVFIQVKPTFVYAMFAVLLAYGLATGRPLLQSLLESAYPGLSARGWRQLTINWTAFFAVSAVANEVARASLDWDQWVTFKTWGMIPATLIFTFANVPMLLRHGLQLEKPADAPVPPPEG
ncbi:intracellular septation protein A [Sphingomonas spermidinifaciens]|uniref:Inner membrane-spanning protein YciB n=1 Tax=Sphingomonas spermidinifaciens TaxID=1141889 RepID=A0A2A4B4F3_9SPHN|nr:inner membrane-spanning protein YciB [Sphingomonas spermidinifaciens]PCD02628.1 intracellular septation protein A [Sphingomonas spermidinifaciens]